MLHAYFDSRYLYLSSIYVFFPYKYVFRYEQQLKR